MKLVFTIVTSSFILTSQAFSCEQGIVKETPKMIDAIISEGYVPVMANPVMEPRAVLSRYERPGDSQDFITTISWPNGTTVCAFVSKPGKRI